MKVYSTVDKFWNSITIYPCPSQDSPSDNICEPGVHYISLDYFSSSHLVRTWPLESFPRVSTGEASGAGFEKFIGLFSSVEIARTKRFWKLGIYIHPFCFPKVRNSTSIWKVFKIAPEWPYKLIFLQFSPAPTFWTQSINHEKKSELLIVFFEKSFYFIITNDIS